MKTPGELISERFKKALTRNSMSQAPATPAASLVAGALEFRLNLRQGCLEFRTDVAEADDDANADDSGDEAVFDCRCARLVIHETRKHGHSYSPNYTEVIFRSGSSGEHVRTAELS